jgi:PadR family transcriptional regulator, regulatory protein PadR
MNRKTMKKSEMLAAFDVTCLVAVIACGANAYGIPIHEEVKNLVSPLRSIEVSAVYRTLHRLERKGLVSAWSGDATQSGAGVPSGISGLQQRAGNYFRKH